MRVMVIGGGGREHALCWKLKASRQVTQVYCAPGNPGTAGVAENVAIASDNISGLVDFARSKNIDFTVVGPERPLTLGVVDRFEEAGLVIFGPSQRAAELEGSKHFAKQVMQAAGVPTAEFKTFYDQATALAYAESRGAPLVVKADGLADGKGVFVCQDLDQVRVALNEVYVRFGQSVVVIEECLYGKEASFIVATDGERIYPLAASHDYKRLSDGDQGPNTGGMGAVSPTPRLDARQQAWALEHVIRPVLREMKSRGAPFSGFLYAGLIIDDQGNIRVLEFNVRLGDPEAQVLLRRMPGDLFVLLRALATRDALPEGLNFAETTTAAVCVVTAAEGYPWDVIKGDEILALDKAAAIKNVEIFHHGTALDQAGCLRTNGGRVLSVTAEAEDVRSAADRAYEAVSCINYRGQQYRSDIAT
ncbi:MAG: phosphoribosylamine--glycine ligase [Deltaproteobacteria bacterium]|nr:phosphoribosylamine--glycine ligase [Deltaproteobacteria bacterium]